MSITWAMFYFENDVWKFAGFETHDERVSEFEDQMDEKRVPCNVVGLRDPVKEVAET